jgi:uncharacterized protein (DUF2141 family)
MVEGLSPPAGRWRRLGCQEELRDIEQQVRRMTIRPAFLITLVAALIFTLQSNASQDQPTSTSQNVIRVEITGARNAKGQILCALFAPGSAFPTKPENAVARTHSEIANGSGVCEFRGVAPGRYAVSAFHDENSNGKIDTNFIGIPKEGLASSNDAKGRMGPPKFDAAAFEYAGGRLELKVKLMYL